MPSQVAVFRTLIVVSLVLALAGAIVDFVFPGLVPEPLSKAYEAYAESESSMSLMVILGGMSIFLLVLAVVSTVGLLVLQPWARPLALWSTAVSFAINPFLGVVLQSGVSLMLIDLSMVLWGAVIAMTFYSDLKVHFERKLP